ncbi:MAG TPA: FtsK/SpoIIIE domain-containing protein, partial [Isosphaeraceae bacterium]|nr:FtsK/SpoIIIE domain-containing protein [Isosphaeraceae bacterium]
MPESSLIPRQVALLRALIQLSAERAKTETTSKSTFATATATADSQFSQASAAISHRFETDSAAEQQAYKSAHNQIENRFQTESAAEEKEYQTVKRSVMGRFNKDNSAAGKAREDARWEAGSVYDAAKENSKKKHEKLSRQLAGIMQEFQPTGEMARGLVDESIRFLKTNPEPPAEIPDEPEADAIETLTAAIERTTTLTSALQRLTIPNLIKIKNYVWIVILFALVLAYPCWLALGLTGGLIACSVVAIVLGVGLYIWLRSVAKVQVGRAVPPLRQALAEVEAWHERTKEQASAALKKQKAESEARRDEVISKAEEAHTKRLAEITLRRDTDLRQLEERHNKQMAEIETRHATDLKQLNEQHARRVAEIKSRFDVDSRTVKEKHQQQQAAAKTTFDTTWNALVEKWQRGMDDLNRSVGEIQDECRRLYLDWHSPDWPSWQPPETLPPGIRFGEYLVNLAQIPNGIPHDDQLRAMTPTSFTLPALVPFPTVGSLLVKAFGPARDQAAQILQAVMLRCLTSLPAGKVRFTIIDPVGLGQNFSAFMHLADYDEQFVTSRIWTEPSQIEQRLTDLTDHMENVIQNYLRNEFETIEEYNVHAGEVAEPFRFLVVANFPVNFSEATMRRLISIASSGARCGVYVLMSVDVKQQMPQGLSLKDIEKHCANVVWIDQKFVWKSAEFEQYPLTLDTPPPPDVFTPLMHDQGGKAKAANKVEVPFDYIAPAADQWWTSSSSNGIDVPLGRAGATRLQHLKLGKGTSQHVLIAGRTGSGKSTLLHALITNVALHYSPEEVELYLIDFKKGVEFKTYATYELPHARVVAIESEREFGLSVLQRLDAELKYRGDRYRDVGAQDLNSYRQANGNQPTPRILLIVDEFQEFFVEDDKVAQETSLLLDRLVRQGRAFGIHVHLGSQTLGGAYALARATIGQMGVRIALQCSESDAHLILSEENSAARLLTRPGEAIYNDANGMVEGNHFFQVVWLAEDRREDYLQKLNQLARDRNLVPTTPQIVFEGNKPADITKNPLLTQLLQAPAWPATTPRASHAWLGEAIAIKDPTEAVFRPQSGSNLLIIGQQDDAALGIFATSIVSLAAQYPPAADADPSSGVRFYLLDGCPVDSQYAGLLGRFAEVIPHPFRQGGWREVPGVIDEIAAELERRQASEGSEFPAIYLMIFDLQRFRELRKAEDDYGFSSNKEEKPSPSKQFTTILRDGPGFHVHTLVWCDTLNNMNRSLDRQALREFEMRILFQMSANDSSSLIDSPFANKLGQHRALFHNEAQGMLEKFRPYGVPTSEWMAEVRKSLGSRPAPQVAEPVGQD